MYLIGCYGDGTHGHQHTRFQCAVILAELDVDGWPAGAYAEQALIRESLKGEMPDDCWDERAALDLLNEWTEVPEGAFWGWQDGDFGLWPSDDD